jgi:hypothetical protein
MGSATIGNRSSARLDGSGTLAPPGAMCSDTLGVPRGGVL